MSRPRTMILMPAGFCVRNFVQSGIVERLAKFSDVDIVAANADDIARGILEGDGIEVWEFGPVRTGRLFRLVDSVFDSAHNLRMNNVSSRVFSEWGRRNWGWIDRAKVYPRDALARMASRQPFFGLLRGVLSRWRKAQFTRQWAESLLRERKPDLVVSTYNVFSCELPYVLAARKLGIPVISHILSFDNLTSRGWLMMVHDQYLVWSERMKEELVKLYPEVRRSRVIVTGTPQFDFHVDKRWSRTRDSVAREHGLDVEKKWIFYGANHALFTPTEPTLVERIARLVRERLGDTVQVIVRAHPMDNAHRWSEIETEGLGIKFCRTGSGGASNRPDLSTREDQLNLINLLRHSSVCLNVASTLSLDAAVLDVPVIGIAFNWEKGSLEGRYYRRFYDTEHYRPLVGSGGLRLVENYEALCSWVKAYLEKPEIDREARRHMVREQCGMADGFSGDRIFSLIKRKIENKG